MNRPLSFGYLYFPEKRHWEPGLGQNDLTFLGNRLLSNRRFFHQGLTWPSRFGFHLDLSRLMMIYGYLRYMLSGVKMMTSEFGKVINYVAPRFCTQEWTPGHEQNGRFWNVYDLWTLIAGLLYFGCLLGILLSWIIARFFSIRTAKMDSHTVPDNWMCLEPENEP